MFFHSLSMHLIFSNSNIFHYNKIIKKFTFSTIIKLLKNLDKHPNDSFKERGIYIGLCK